MSTPAQEGTQVPEEKKENGIRKLLARARTVLRPKDRDSSKRFSTLSAKPGPSSAAPPAAGSSSQPAPAPAAKEPAAAGSQPTRVPKSQLYEERARKLAERYGLDIKPGEWHSSEGDALRVEKPIRMRVRRYCHVCQQAFGSATECANCKHNRCKECVRYPPKLNDSQKEDARKRRAALVQKQKDEAPIIPDWDPSRSKKIELKRPGKPGGQDHVYKKPRQRVRRFCHECKTVFLSGSKKCESCGHIRCTDCPRDPAKKDRYPYGYPGDVFGPNSVPHYTCHACHTLYPPNPPEEAACVKCGHRRCSSCERLGPKRIEPEPDPALWESVQSKLRELNIAS